MHKYIILYCKYTNYSENLMLSNIANEYKKNVKLKRLLINAVCACASYIRRPFLPREAAARGLLEVSLRRRLRKIPTDSSSGPSEEGCREQQLRQVRYY